MYVLWCYVISLTAALDQNHHSAPGVAGERWRRGATVVSSTRRSGALTTKPGRGSASRMSSSPIPPGPAPANERRPERGAGGPKRKGAARDLTAPQFRFSATPSVWPASTLTAVLMSKVAFHDVFARGSSCTSALALPRGWARRANCAGPRFTGLVSYIRAR